MTNSTTKTTKTDLVKNAIMEMLNSEESSTRKELDGACLTISSARTISRVLASLKLAGRINQVKTGKDFFWISLETPKKEKTVVTDPGKADLVKQIDTLIETKTPDDKAGKTDIPAKKKDEKIDPTKKNITDEIKEMAAKMDDTKIVGFGTEFYATGIEKAGKWTTRDLFIMDKLNINYEFAEKGKKDGKKTDKKKAPASKKSDKKAGKGTKTDPKKEKKGDSEKKKKTITKDNLIDAGKKGVKRNPAPAQKPAKKSGPAKVGVIATIIKAITGKRCTKAQILAKLIKVIPERDPKKMMKTINVQVPTRLKKDKGLKIEKTDKGYRII